MPPGTKDHPQRIGICSRCAQSDGSKGRRYDDRVVSGFVSDDCQCCLCVNCLRVINIQWSLFSGDIKELSNCDFGVHLCIELHNAITVVGDCFALTNHCKFSCGEKQISSKDCGTNPEIFTIASGQGGTVMCSESSMRRGTTTACGRVVDDVIMDQGAGLVEL